MLLYSIIKRFNMKFCKILLLIFMISPIYVTHDLLAAPTIPFAIRPIPPGPVTLSLGGTSIVNIDDPFSGFQNPAKIPMTNYPQVTFSLYNEVVKEISYWDDNHFSGTKGPDVSDLKINYLGFSCPFQLFSMNMAASISYYPLYTFERSFSFEQKDENEMTDQRQWHFNQNGYLSAISMAYGIKFHSDWSFGLSWNFFRDDLLDNQFNQEISMKGHRKNIVQFDEYFRQKISQEFSGNNLNIGLLWQIFSCLKAGAVIQTQLKSTVSSHLFEFHSFNGNPPETSPIISSTDYLEIPMSWGIGMCYSPIDRWKLLMDFRQITWEDLHYENSIETTQFISGHTDKDHNLNVDMIHVGSVYQSMYRIKLFKPVFRMGISYCTNRGMIHPEPDSAIGFGFGLIGKNLDFNIGYQYQRYDDITQETSQAGTLHDRIRNNVLEMSLTYRIKK